MVSEKVVVVLLVLAIILSVVSLVITLNVNLYFNKSGSFGGGSQTGQISLVILPPSQGMVQNETTN